MKNITAQILKFYFEKMREPKLEELTIEDDSLKEKWCCFVTLYLNGEVRWSAWNIKEIHSTIAEELISNTMQALTWDKRFSPLTREESEKIGFRVDKIENREMISLKDITGIDPVQNWVISIQRSYDKLAVVLPNMSPKLMTWDDFIPVLQNKLETKTIDDHLNNKYDYETHIIL